jgi:uncharacterized protein (TIRG00374 family)
MEPCSGKQSSMDVQADNPSVSRRLISRSIRYAIGIGLLVYIFSLVPLVDVFAAIRRSRPDYLLAALFVAITLQWLVAYRLRRVVNALGGSYSTAELFGINAATRFYGLFLPGGNVTGIAVRFYKIGSTRGMYAETALTLYSERVIATISLCAIGLIFWAMDQPAAPFWVMQVMGVVLLGSLYLLAVLMGVMPLLFAKLIDRGMTRVGGSVMTKVRRAVEQFRELPRSILIVVVSLSFVIHLLGICTFLLIAMSLGWSISFVSLGWIRSGLILATMIPISISGLGLREAAALLLLGTYGDDEAVAFSLLVFAITVLVFSLLGGVIEGRRFANRESRND